MITVVGSLKGGSGKSTVTFNLAVWLAMAEVNLRVLDLDPQATLRDVAEIRAEDGFVPALKVETKSALEDKTLADADEVLIDIGMADLDAMKKAMSIADRVIVPVPPSQADIWSAQRFVKFVHSQEEDVPEMISFINRGDTHHAVRETDETAAALISLPNLRFIKPRLSMRTLFRRSFSEGRAVFEMSPKSKGSVEFRALCAHLYPWILG